MTPTGTQISKAELDAHYKAGDFAEQPQVSGFGDGPGEPYNPNREAWGTLKDGRQVWAWVRGPKAEEPVPQRIALLPAIDEA